MILVAAVGDGIVKENPVSLSFLVSQCGMGGGVERTVSFVCFW